MLPEIYQQFVQKIASSKVLQRLCSDQLHELKWRHALREQLGAMWEQFRYPQPPSRNRRKDYRRILRVTLHSTCACCAPRTTQQPRPLVRPGRSRLERALVERVADVKGLLVRHIPHTRQLLRKLIPGRIVCTPFDDARGRGYVLAATGTYAGLLGQHIAVKQSGGEGGI